MSAKTPWSQFRCRGTNGDPFSERAVSGSKGSVIGSTVLNGPVSGIEVQFWIQGGTIVAPYGKGDSPNRVGYWKYPTGGRLRRRIKGPGFDNVDLFGTVVSLAH